MENGEITIKNDGVNIIDILSETEDMSIFKANTIQEILFYKYNSFGFKFLFFGLIMNLFFTAMIILYVYEIYILGADEDKLLFLILVGISNIYPVAYEIN